MARGVITVTPISRTSVDGKLTTATTGDASNGHSVVNNGTSVFLIFKNTNGASTVRTATVRNLTSADGLAAATHRVYTIPAGETWYRGPFPTATYGTTMQIDVSHAEMTIQAFQTP